MTPPAREHDAIMAMVRASLAAADPWALTRERLSLTDDAINIVHTALIREGFEKIFVIGAGKAGAPMAAAVEDAFGDLVAGGLVVVKDGYRTVGTSRIEIIEGAHPVPDERAPVTARRILEMAARAGRGNNILICLISGGGSALLTLPAEGLTLEDVRETTAALLRSGAPIEEVNTVRKHLTLASGGKVALAAGDIPVFSLIISDVIGDDLGIIASGPTYPDSTSYSNALNVLELRGLFDQVPEAVVGHLRSAADSEYREDANAMRRRILEHGSFCILGSNRIALEAAAATASMLDLLVFTLDEPATGEAREAAAALVARARELSLDERAAGRDICVLAGGETTVTVTGGGIGGRAQEFVLAAALAIDGLENMLVFAFGTDGTDGFTDAAGAFADGTTVARARAMGFDLEQHLRDNDSFPIFDALDDLIVTGPTGTNVNDIYGVIIRPTKSEEGRYPESSSEERP